jgi:hypothetical protein
MVDLKEAGVDILTFGQYLQPTPLHLTVKEFVSPDKFEQWRKYAEDVIGFRCVTREIDYKGLQYRHLPVICRIVLRLPLANHLQQKRNPCSCVETIVEMLRSM